MPELYFQGRAYPVPRLKLRAWLAFEQTQKAIQEAVDHQDGDEYAKHISVLVATAFVIPIEQVEAAPWFEVALAHQKLSAANLPRVLPMLQHPEKDAPVPWDYPGRTWYWWVHLFASAYGWSAAQVEDLDIDDALALLQEIQVDEQTEREWQWSLSELAYPYNETTKKSSFKPLPRPAWMSGKAATVIGIKVKFRKGMLPVGAVVGEDGHERIVH